MAGYKFLDTDEADEVWNNYVKKGKVKGASVEGNFILNFSRQEKDEYLLQEIINILTKIK
jgi:phage head maturation protease